MDTALLPRPGRAQAVELPPPCPPLFLSFSFLLVSLPSAFVWIAGRLIDQIKINRFTLERKVTNWDIEYLEGRIRSLVASTRYTGTLTVDFPITYCKVVVRKGKDDSSSSGFLGKLIPSKNKKPELDIKRYDIVQSVWPYATVLRGSKTVDYAKLSEQDWWEVWEFPIRNSILAKKRGWVTVEDRMEAAMGLDLPVKMDWGNGNEWSWK